jgi:methionyl-tRNA formyltransferase
MANYIIVSERKWNNSLKDFFNTKYPMDKWYFFLKKEDINIDNFRKINPTFIFFPHWSYIIPESVFSEFTCIVFHMTDLPFGRGGSPLQNLISRGFENTYVSAIKVEQGIDAGDIYIKEPLSLYGTAEEIFLRANNVLQRMIERIITEDIQPYPQTGEIVLFRRRTPEDSSIESLDSIEKIYDYIRMLDAEGYPHAFLIHENIRFEFTRASLKANGAIIADVKITKYVHK